MTDYAASARAARLARLEQVANNFETACHECLARISQRKHLREATTTKRTLPAQNGKDAQ